MPTRLDILIGDFSQAVGEFRACIRNLENRADEDRDARRQEHRENQQAIGDLRNDTQKAIAELRKTASERWKETTDEVGELRRDLKQHADAVASIRAVRGTMPKISPRIAFYATVGFGTLVFAGWVLEAAIKYGVNYLLGKLGP